MSENEGGCILPKCKCGNEMHRWGIVGMDLFGNECFECSNCGMFMKKVPYGDPGKKSYILFELLSFVVTKKVWLPKDEFDEKTTFIRRNKIE